SVPSSAISTLAGYSRRSFRVTRICRMFWMTWLLVTTIPSGRTITPEPMEPVTRDCGPPPNNSKKGSRTCWMPRAEIFTTAGAASRTTGAKLVFSDPASRGATRGCSAKTPSCALVGCGWPQADRIRAAAMASLEVFISSRFLLSLGVPSIPPRLFDRIKAVVRSKARRRSNGRDPVPFRRAPTDCRSAHRDRQGVVRVAVAPRRRHAQQASQEGLDVDAVQVLQPPPGDHARTVGDEDRLHLGRSVVIAVGAAGLGHRPRLRRQQPAGLGRADDSRDARVRA